ncbi:MAG TPA: crosslink repair DNA glycosylase YcaQ family protein [Steroidobacteraceae bacterium]|jgi:hypothetical protein|nr:crosslink repair DNA glycosylase YcaQ family protein [Steroidobacteraceae bacterium]
MPITLDHLRRYAVARSLFKPTTLQRAIRKLGFVQADPIRAPARAQDLTLRHRVRGYRAGDLERRYSRLAVEEDFFVNYGYLPRVHQRLMHPRTVDKPWCLVKPDRAASILEFIRARGIVHPREVDAHFAHGRVTNWFGGSSNVTTQILDAMHYRGMLRVARREGGTRVYVAPQVTDAAAQSPPLDPAAIEGRMDAMVDIIVGKYAPLPAITLSDLVRRLRHGAPQWSKHCAGALARAKSRLGTARVEGVDWYWPAAESPRARRWRLDDEARLLTPFDPIVWDRKRFEILWDWVYRFEAYTPPRKRKLGYYALPLLWRERVVGWGNAAVVGTRLECSIGYANGIPREAAFRRALEAELERLREFLGLEPTPPGRRAPPRQSGRSAPAARDRRSAR